MVSSADANRLRLAQAGLRRLVERDLDAFFASLDPSRPEAARDALLAFLPTLVSAYGESAAAVAADWYDDVRAAEAVPGRFRAVLAASPYLDAVDGTVRRAAGSLFTEEPAGTLGTLRAVVPKYVLAAARETITRSTDGDPRASGWQRVTQAGACGFCRMLAGRGAVYKESTVHFAAHGGGKRGGQCHCAAVPSWDPDAPEVDVVQYRASMRMTALRLRAERGDAGAARQIEDHNALIQRAIEQYT
ncbi:MAG TPA: hypothetical protein VE379_07965 [Vicinamibacterales bacterium]|jgi:hypothetical protein|nr:hypothetical protein [Vicinamibacterales bacterium]